MNPVSELMRITSSQQASGVELNGALRVYNMASGPAKQLHTAGGQFLLSTERKERGDRGMRPQSCFKGRRHLYIGRLGYGPWNFSFRCISSAEYE